MSNYVRNQSFNSCATISIYVTCQNNAVAESKLRNKTMILFDLY